MNRLAGLFACVVALGLCSCGAKVEQARTEAAPPPPDNRARAEAARVEEVRGRWNEAVGGDAVTLPQVGAVNFRWEPDKVPHPTSKGDSAEAYGAFAKALVKFFETDSNFVYLLNNYGSKVELRHTLPSGQVSKWTFVELAEQLAAPGATGTHDEATRKKLKEFADKLKAPPKA